ncbi:MAG: protein-L-isoaspartate(D-aspartate) O-methyltransferase [Planctomycetia bacterium]|nr:protein-L-isoaspartate(D-aspartate) O-methyltransferase [Planctomycetia bacterium]
MIGLWTACMRAESCISRNLRSWQPFESFRCMIAFAGTRRNRALRPRHASTQKRWAGFRAAAGVKSPRILAVMRTAPRHEFVPADVRQYAYLDMALPIGEHQTISPPFVVAYMTAQLDPRPTDTVLEIGTGSGYQAAVLSGLVKQVYTIEIEKSLAQQAAKVFKKLGYKNIELKLGDGYQGWAEHAPFDKIIVTCSPEKVPRQLVEQLREGGRIVIPLGERYQQTLFSMKKQDGKLVVASREPTFFVPMTGKAESLRSGAPLGPLTPLANGDFEEQLDPGKPAGWYYVRQARLDTSGPVATAQHCIAFSNRVPGRSSQALQAIGVDGREVAELAVELWVQARDVEQGQTPDQRAKVLVTFFDENRVPAGQQALGPWVGSFDWQRRSARLKVPPNARVAIVAVGLLGATGELACDQLGIRVASSRIAIR